MELWRIKKIHNRDLYCEDMRRDDVRASPSCPFDPINTITFSTMMKRE
jgi:hypothetical protein